MAVSSANVPTVSPPETGMSEVYNTYNMGPRTPPCETSEIVQYYVHLDFHDVGLFLCSA
jgi:hypothetical protein